jgi:hypothetical protein
MICRLLVALAFATALPAFAQSRPATMGELAAAFSSNPIAARRQFSDFLITGSVSSIAEGKTPGTARIFFIEIDKSAPSYKMTYFVEVKTTEDDAVLLAKGEAATFRCKSARKEEGSGLHLVLEACRIAM